MPLPKKISSSSLSGGESKVVAGRYRVERKLGSGSFGTVFLVVDNKADNELKVMKQIFIGELQADDTVDAVREAKLLAKLDHPSIVRFHDSFLEKDSFFIITENCEGGDLDMRIKSWKETRKQFEESLILDWFVQLTNAIWYIHERRILHRDIKTRNIFLRNNCIKLGDFGISKILMGTSDLATTVTGTPYYMSPEVLKHDGYNSKSDIWSLGLVLYEICTLEKAYHGETLLGVMYKIIEGDKPALPSHLNKELQDLFQRMIDKDPQGRPSAREILSHHFIKTHMEELSRKMTMKLNLTPSCASPEDVEAIANAVKPVKKESLASSTDTDEQLTPREKLILKKHQKADEEAKLRRQLAAQNLEEGRKRYSENKKKDSRVPPWVEEHPEVFSDPNFSLTKNTFDISVTQYSAFSDDKPNDPDLAETHYLQFDDFEEVEEEIVLSESEEELEALVGYFEEALQIKNEDSLPVAWEDVRPVGPEAKKIRIENLRRECIKAFGESAFRDIYDYLRRARSSKGYNNEEVVISGLKQYIDNTRDCFLIDQLIFMEDQLCN